MDTIAHRELRNDSSAILARVAAGESIAVTNRGQVAAVLIPPPASELDRVRLASALRPARVVRTRFVDIARADGLATREILEDLRGDR